MVEESELAHNNNQPSPICPSYEATSDSYHSCLTHVITHLSTNPNSQLLVATHNQSTCQLAV